MKPSKLVESGWANMSYYRNAYEGSEVLAVAYGPYESRNSQKSDYSRSLVEVVVSDISITIDHSQTEKILSDLFSSVIDIDKYPYLSFMICIQVFTKDSNYLSTCINAAYQAIARANIEVKHKIIAKDFYVEESKITLAIVPGSEYIMFSLCEKPVKQEFYRQCVSQLASEKALF